MKSKQTKNIVGLYLRLSHDDERAGESLSIENQRSILLKYVKKRVGKSMTFILMTTFRERRLKDRAYKDYWLTQRTE